MDKKMTLGIVKVKTPETAAADDMTEADDLAASIYGREVWERMKAEWNAANPLEAPLPMAGKTKGVTL